MVKNGAKLLPLLLSEAKLENTTSGPSRRELGGIRLLTKNIGLRPGQERGEEQDISAILLNSLVS